MTATSSTPTSASAPSRVPAPAPTDDDDEDRLEGPFEWLTNFDALRPFLSPSRVLFGDGGGGASAGDDDSAVEVEDGAEASDRYGGCDRCEGDDDVNDDSEVHSLRAVDFGCGRSAVGTRLLSFAEDAPRPPHPHASREGNFAATAMATATYGSVLHVDVDDQALRSSRRRWEREAQEGGGSGTDRGRMEWRRIDFTDEASCRAALDDADGGGGAGGGGTYDLVLDKCTLDCLLCAETSAAAGILCEAHDALRPLPVVPSRSRGRRRGRLGGIYVVVTFHNRDLVSDLLENLPGAEWDVTWATVERRAALGDGGSERRGGGKDDRSLPFPDGVGCPRETIDPDNSSAREPSPSPWTGNGTSDPDESNRRTLNVFTCRRRLRVSGDDGVRRIDRSAAEEHVRATCDRWFRDVNPLSTEASETRLREAFAAAALEEEAAVADRAADQEVETESSAPTLGLDRCYRILFTDAERAHLPYEDFLEDWAAYLAGKDAGGCSAEAGGVADGERATTAEASGVVDILRDRMTADVAVDFLREMQ